MTHAGWVNGLANPGRLCEESLMQLLDIPTVTNRIAVQPPYFAFTTMELDADGAIHGEFIPEQPLEYEAGPASAAEIGRHLAILGSCAAAAKSGVDRLYYLATKADYKQLRRPAESTGGRPLRATARIASQGRRNLTVKATVSDGVPFATLDVGYNVLSESLFSRLFAERRVAAMDLPSESPYKTLLPMEFQSVTDTQVVSHLGEIDPVQCAGHFQEYPVWPVALMMHSLGRVGADLLHRRMKYKARYSVIRAQMSADVLAFACLPITFQANWDTAMEQPPEYGVTCRAIQNDTVAAEMLVSFRVDDKAN
jgi:hypothetical protein